MNSLKTLLFTKSLIAATLAASGFANATTLPANLPGSPDDGMVCRSGYTPSFSGTRLTCSKAGSFDIPLECKNPNFPVYVVRNGGPAPKGDDDICIRNNGTVITINQSLAGLAESTNGVSGVYEYAKFDPANVTTRTRTQDDAEAAALGLKTSEVDTLAGVPVIRPNGRAGGAGEARVPVTFFTFATPAAGGVIVIGPVVGSPTPFVPRPLP